jgi:hypothetical protein
MRKWIVFGVFCLVGLSLRAQSLADFRLMFWKQLSETCQQGLRFEKSVDELEEGEPTKHQARTFDIDCARGKMAEGKDTFDLDQVEFAYLFEYAFDNPYQGEHLKVVREGKSVHATIQAGKESAAKLHLQNFEVDATTGKLRKAEAKVVKNSALSDLTVHTTVWFDEAGHYLRHETETITDVLMGGDLHTVIQGRLAH